MSPTIRRAAAKREEQIWFDLLPVAVYVCGAPDGALWRYNRRAEELWGRRPKPGERYSGALRMYVDGLPADGEDSPAAVVLRTGVALRNVEAEVERPDGSRVTVCLDLEPVLNERGQVRALIGALHEITRQKRDAHALRVAALNMREQQRWLEAVLDLLPLPLMFVEPGAARVSFANRAATNAFREAAGALVAGVARGERIEAAQVSWRAPDGDRTLLARGETLPAMYGNRATGVLVLEDVTDLKRAEEALRQAQKLESLGVLAGGVAHDFNNLLTGILGNASLVLEGLGAADPARVLVEEIIRASESAAGLTQHLLAYSGKGHFTVRPVDLSEQVSEIISLVHTSLPKSVSLRTSLGTGLPALMGDAPQLHQVIMNLVINAGEAIGEGRPGTVEIVTGVEEVDEAAASRSMAAGELRPGRYVFVAVHDDGQGMDEATARRIFDPFFSTKFTGRGLGLAAVLGIVRAHGGAIEVASVPGHGTTIRVLFPAAGAAAAQAGADSLQEDLSGEGVILVVDDEETVRKTVKAGLQRYGYTVLLTENGRQALELFRTAGDRVSLVLLDVAMPVMGGEETLAALRALRPDIPVLLCTAYSEQEAGERFHGRELTGFLQKPYTAQALARKVKQALDGKRD